MILIYNDSLSGHRLEFFHHIYEGAIRNEGETYIFVYPTADSYLLDKMDWQTSDHIRLIDYDINSTSLYNKYMVLRKCVKAYNPSRLILMDLMSYIPYLTLYRKVNVCGIIMGVYLYTWHVDSILKRLSNIFKYWLISTNPVIKNVFIQSDTSAVSFFNRKYKTKKFRFICDPIVPLGDFCVADLCKKYGIPNDKRIILHPGDISYRKGSLALIKALASLPQEFLNNYYFIFAGRVNSNIKDEFDHYYNILTSRGGNVKLIHGFLPFEDLASLVSISEFLFIPYILTNQSSGIVGYGAQFKKPVVVTRFGLLSKIVKRNHLGFIIEDSSIESIVSFLINPPKWEFKENDYININNKHEFARVLLDE